MWNNTSFNCHTMSALRRVLPGVVKKAAPRSRFGNSDWIPPVPASTFSFMKTRDGKILSWDVVSLKDPTSFSCICGEAMKTFGTSGFVCEKDACPASFSAYKNRYISMSTGYMNNNDQCYFLSLPIVFVNDCCRPHLSFRSGPEGAMVLRCNDANCNSFPILDPKSLLKQLRALPTFLAPCLTYLCSEEDPQKASHFLESLLREIANTNYSDLPSMSVPKIDVMTRNSLMALLADDKKSYKPKAKKARKTKDSGSDTDEMVEEPIKIVKKKEPKPKKAKVEIDLSDSDSEEKKIVKPKKKPALKKTDLDTEHPMETDN